MLCRHVCSTIAHLPKPYHRLPFIRCLSTDTDNTVSTGICLYDSSPRTFRDLLTPHRINLLHVTLAPYLPLNLPRPSHTPGLAPGHHFIFFPTSVSETDSLSDGYEKHFAPKAPFVRRLWTQGRLEFNKGRKLRMREWAVCKEELEDVVDNEGGTDVWISRTMYSEGEEDEWNVRELRCVRYLRQIPPC